MDVVTHNHSHNLATEFEKITIKPSHSLPIEVITDILLRLPAKPLLCFKCVCKSWYTLISGQDFADRHLERSLATKTNLHFLFRSPQLHLGDFETFDNGVELNHPFKGPPAGGISIIGCCNGLVCFWNIHHYYYFPVAVLNPTTRTFRVLPILRGLCARPSYTFGFGFDPVSNDYKFVRISVCREQDVRCSHEEVMVYSLKSNEWTKVLDDVPYRFGCRREDGVFLNGALHWVIDSKRDEPPNPIVGFHLGSNSFFELPVPKFYMEWYCFMHVGVLDGCLCVVLHSVDEYEFWMMKEYGVAESWTKMFNFGKCWKRVDNIERLVTYVKNGKELLVELCLDRITSIDMETLVLEHVEALANPDRLWDAHVCVENLLMLEEFCDDLEREEEQGESSKKKKKKKQKRRRRHKRN